MRQLKKQIGTNVSKVPTLIENNLQRNVHDAVFIIFNDLLYIIVEIYNLIYEFYSDSLFFSFFLF